MSLSQQQRLYFARVVIDLAALEGERSVCESMLPRVEEGSIAAEAYRHVLCQVEAAEERIMREAIGDLDFDPWAYLRSQVTFAEGWAVGD